MPVLVNSVHVGDNFFGNRRYTPRLPGGGERKKAGEQRQRNDRNGQQLAVAKRPAFGGKLNANMRISPTKGSPVTS